MASNLGRVSRFPNLQSDTADSRPPTPFFSSGDPLSKIGATLDDCTCSLCRRSRRRERIANSEPVLRLPRPERRRLSPLEQLEQVPLWQRAGVLAVVGLAAGAVAAIVLHNLIKLAAWLA